MQNIEFTLEKDLKKIPQGSALICGIDMDPVTAYGKLRSLFGAPTIETKNLEEQYYYCLTAKLESEKVVCIYAYCGSGGPAIGGLEDRESKMAACKLCEMIYSAKTADYQYEGFYMDTFSKIRMGIKDGVPYLEEEYCEEIPVLW